ncbi:ATP-binding protein [bacterium]|nr:ATP-binding protein [bacterium]
MFHSLRFRFALASIAIVVIAVGTVGILSTRVSNREFQRYVNTGRKTNLISIAQTLQAHYDRQMNWSGVEQILERSGSAAGKRLILIDTAARVIAAWPRDLVRSSFRLDSKGTITFEIKKEQGREVSVNELALNNMPRQLLFDKNRESIGTLFETELNFGIETDQFTLSVTRGVLLSVITAGLLALIATLAFSRKLLSPIERLTIAARSLEMGDLRQRVPVQSKDETGELAHAFNSMAESLERLEQLRRNMVSDIAHELRTPLTNIRCQLEAVQDGLIRPDAVTIHSLHEEAMLLNALIDDLQDLALADAGKLKLSPEEISIRREIESAVTATQHLLIGKKLVVITKIPDDLPLIYADPKRIGQTLRNLLNNAIAHSSSNSRIIIAAEKVERDLQISIRDSGEGISPEDLPYVFERFFRSDRSRTRKTGGAGLGLAIVQQLVQAHGGRVSIESKVGEGTTITFTLPLEFLIRITPS